MLIVAGHRRYPGAPRLAAGGALRMGAGLLRLVVPEPAYCACRAPAAVMVDAHPAEPGGGFAIPPSSELLAYLQAADALVIGPGMGQAAAGLAGELLARCEVPVVVDADALTSTTLKALSAGGAARRWPALLTPHPGELARCLGLTTAEVLGDWFGAVRRLAESFGAFVLGKASQSVLAAPDGTLYFPQRGHPALATGGTGDVLSGMLGAALAELAAQRRLAQPAAAVSAHRALGPEFIEAVLGAVSIHAMAGRLMAERIGERSAIADDLVELIATALRELA